MLLAVSRATRFVLSRNPHRVSTSPFGWSHAVSSFSTIFAQVSSSLHRNASSLRHFCSRAATPNSSSLDESLNALLNHKGDEIPELLVERANSALRVAPLPLSVSTLSLLDRVVKLLPDLSGDPHCLNDSLANLCQLSPEAAVRMLQRSQRPHIVHFLTLIAGLGATNRPDLVPDLLDVIARSEYSVDEVCDLQTFVNVTFLLHSIHTAGQSPPRSPDLLSRDPSPDSSTLAPEERVELYHVAMLVLCNLRLTSQAVELLDWLEADGDESIDSYNALLKSFVLTHQFEHWESTLDRMRTKGIQPNAQTRLLELTHKSEPAKVLDWSEWEKSPS
eukprot:gnl/Spiro4/27623_TR13752_c0_g1_i1.p1 gnl/Spiro4/27623_TR13752_c0_g1~~gnl/Spiro4/27623_TR13752_c0_g1_i1.p1  ORF type:complete len:333 (-),score=14.99 gnl/Spiro4/27623_TR13752_c0_g1_i1:88-1086(-)